MKQTAVEWLELNLLGLISFDSEELRAKYKDRIAKAKEIEKKQIVSAHGNKEKKSSGVTNYTSILTGEEYYDKTYR
jgi:hypothetical protein